MTSFVVDASVALAWLYPDQRSDFTDATLQHATANNVYVPDLFVLQIVNSLAKAERRGRVGRADIDRFVEDLMRLELRNERCDPQHAFGTVRAIATHHGLTAYDAAYVDLARRLDLPIASLDEQLIVAAAELGVARFEP